MGYVYVYVPMYVCSYFYKLGRTTYLQTTTTSYKSVLLCCIIYNIQYIAYCVPNLVTLTLTSSKLFCSATPPCLVISDRNELAKVAQLPRRLL